MRFLGFLVVAALALAASRTHAATPAISAGNTHAVILKTDGTVWVIGSSLEGRNGLPASPVQVPGMSDVISIAAGASSSGFA